MDRKTHNKLIRDKIPEIIERAGDKPITHLAGDEEYWEKLKQKLQEEVDEFIKKSTPEELADILEVIEAIEEYKKFNRKEILKLKDKKAKQRGKFKKKIILDES